MITCEQLPNNHYISRPNTGTVAKTKYQVKCSGWQTIDKPIKYQFMTKPTSSAGSSASFEGSEDIPIWYAGSEPWNPANMLPLGDAKNNYTLQVIVRVYNIFGAYVELQPLSTKVIQVSMNIKYMKSHNTK